MYMTESQKQQIQAIRKRMQESGLYPVVRESDEAIIDEALTLLEEEVANMHKKRIESQLIRQIKKTLIFWMN